MCRGQAPMKDAGRAGRMAQVPQEGQASDERVLRVEIASGRFWFRIHMENSLAVPRRNRWAKTRDR